MTERLNKRNIRREAICDEIAKKQYCSVHDLMARFKVSESTIKRDLDLMETQGKVKRVYGGVFLVESQTDLPSFQQRAKVSREAKEVIAKKAAEMICDGDVIFLDAGSTINYMLKYIKAKDIVVFTNSVSIILEMVNNDYDFEVNVVSGKLLKNHSTIMGIQTINEIDGLYFDKVFLSSAYIDFDYGVLVDTYNEKMYKSKLVKCSNTVILCSDSSKIKSWNKMKCIRFDDIDYFITDKYLPLDIFQRIKKQGTEVVRVG
ncbi:MAG: DeoR/GlpR family DNA-binding transcription regulator [Eubacteriales bacterium]|nr:DeoR/GlpR family DNA-binding transcription regulator [Eubacteriales bacterium]